MNPHKIAFICCTNDEDAFDDFRRYIHALELPAGFESEIVPVVGASGMASGYNEGMHRTDAKYKVYLHQDVLIVHRGFLTELIALFEQNPAIGLVGVTGAERLPSQGVWWESADRTGKVWDSYTGRLKLLDFGGGPGTWTEVQAVDGLLMATQADLPWRADLFPGWHFYDASQCMEFIRAGYRVAVPSQSAPWCLHDCGISPINRSFHEARENFCRHYRNAGECTKPRSE